MRIKLVVRYTAISSLILLAVMAINAFLHINKVQNNFVDNAIVENDALAELILLANYHLMLQGDREHLQLMIEEVAKADRIKRIRILGKEGIIKFSNNTFEIGTKLNRKDDSCVFCHLEKDEVLVQVPIEKRSRLYSEDGIELLSVTRGIYNEPNCYTAQCHAHSALEKKIGVLDIVVSLERMSDLAHAHHVDVLISTTVILIILSFGHYLLTQRYICDPIEMLLAQTQALSEGDLTARVKRISNDELGELGQSFNTMAENLAHAQLELKDWGNTLEQKVEMRTAEIRKMQDQLLRSAKLASMGELVAGIAHEINNPLTGILMFASLSARTPDLPQQVKENLDVIVSETGRCAKIVRGLLEFARESIPEKKPDSINRIILHTLELVSQQAIFQDIDICCNYDEGLPQVELDADQMQQVFFNMFVNAGQAMPNGGRLTIESRYLAADNEIEVTVADTGSGIRREDLERIFDPFFSTKSQKGFGLGLSVSYGIIRNHGGRVDVESKEGRGTCFTIHLPVETEPYPVDGSEESEGKPPTA